MTEAEADPEAYRQELVEHRLGKDEFFAEHRQSPIPPSERDDFDGLDYFDPDLDYRVEATVTAHDDPEAVTMDVTDGREMRYLRLATLSFEIGDTEQTLAAYRREGEEGDSLFVPFRDKTTGQQTYHQGRYMELHPEGDLTDGQEIILDFNMAYAPFCAYSETFSCPLPPEENWLDVEIRAGERTDG